MNILRFDEIISNLAKKSKEINETLEEINTFDFNNLDITTENLDLIESIKSNLDIINNKLEDFKCESLQIQNENHLNYVQKQKLKELIFHKMFMKLFMPYMIYLRLCLYR